LSFKVLGAGPAHVVERDLALYAAAHGGENLITDQRAHRLQLDRQRDQ
jgi:hypothetical protein